MRWAHILSAVILVGGVFFMRFMLMPAVKENLQEKDSRKLHTALMDRWKRVAMISMGLLLISGIYNFITLSIPKGKETALYHPLFGIKFLAAFCIFFVTSALLGRSQVFEGMRKNPGKWMAFNLVLAIVVILIGGVLKNLG